METKEIKCPAQAFLAVVGGKWKIAILCNIKIGTMRFGEFKRKIDGITQKMLTSQLRELEADGIINRKVFPVVPPKVEYTLTKYGESLFPVLKEIENWGFKHVKKINTERKSTGKTILVDESKLASIDNPAVLT